MSVPFFNFQQIAAAVSILCFLASALTLFASAFGVTALLVIRKRRWAAWLFACMVLVVAFYGATLTGFSLASREQVLAAGQEKYFCEVDCHLAYSLLGVTTAPRLGNSPHQIAAHGTFYVVRVRTWFDERTISPRRPKDAPLTRSPRNVLVVDDLGRRFEPSAEGQRALESAEGPQPSLSGPLIPGQSSTADLVFDLSGDVKNPRLLIADSDWITHFLIGNENSFSHAKTTFRLEPAAEAGQHAGKQL